MEQTNDQIAMSSSVEDHDQEPIAALPTPRVRVSGLAPNALLALGLALFGAGSLLAASPRLSWSLYRIARQVEGVIALEAIGVLGGVVMAAGLIGRWITTLSRQLSDVSDDHVDLTLQVDRLSDDVADLRSGLDLIVTGREADEASSTAAAIAGQNEKDALFRMAASLDQLSGRLTQRVSAEVASLHEEIARLSSGAPAPPASAEAPAAAPVVEAAASADPLAHAPAFEPAPAPKSELPAPEEEDDAIMINLDADEGGLGLLDQLGDEENKRTIDVDIYEPDAALPKKQAAPEQAPQEGPASYHSSLDRLLPDQQIDDAIDGAR